MPRQSIKGQGAMLKRVLQALLKYYTPHLIVVLVCIMISTWCTLQGTMFMKTLIDDYLLPMTSGALDTETGFARWPLACSPPTPPTGS